MVFGLAAGSVAYFLKSRAHSRAENKVDELKVEVIKKSVDLDNATTERDSLALAYKGAKATADALNKLKNIIPAREGEDPEAPVATVVKTEDGDKILLAPRAAASLAGVANANETKRLLIISLEENLTDTTKTLNKVRASRPWYALGGFIGGVAVTTAIVIAVN